MKRALTIPVLAAFGLAGCTGDGPPAGTDQSTQSLHREHATKEVAAKIDIYTAVIRRLVTRDHTFGTGPSPFRHVYVINGPISKAGDPLGDHFGPAPRRFPAAVVKGLEKRLRSLPPLRFVSEANDLRTGKQGAGGVKRDGVILSLGHIERKKRDVQVSTGLWCGGTCGQWLTYVLSRRDGAWRITGTTGPYAIS